LRAARSISISP